MSHLGRKLCDKQRSGIIVLDFVGKGLVKPNVDVYAGVRT